MSRTSALGNFTLLPVLADAADITQVGTTMADRIEKYVLMRFTSVANRDATVTSPEEGMHCITTDQDRVWVYSGAAWIPVSWYSITGRIGGTWRRSAVLSVANNTVTSIPWDAEDADTDGFLTPTSTTATVPTGLGGLYMVTATTVWSITGIGANIIRITAGSLDPIEVSATTTSNGYQTVSAMVSLGAAQTVTIQVLQTSGGALNMSRARVDLYRMGV